MTDDTPLLHRLQQSPLTASRRTKLSASSPLDPERSVLCGIRGTYRPTIALQTIKRMGPIRHALAQRSIAGFLEVHAPFSKDGKP